MFKKAINFVATLLISLTLIFSMNIYATENQNNEEIQTEVEENLEDLTKRMVLSTFGRDALNWFDVNSDLDYSVEITDDELSSYTKPFNSNNFLLVQSFILVTIFVGFIIFSVYLYWIFKEGIIKTQNSGQFLGGNWNSMFTISKIAIVTVLLFPAFGVYSTSHVLMFKVLGYSNEVSKEINSSIISNQPKTFPSIKFPHSTVKKNETEKIIQFASCVKVHRETNNEINLNFNKQEGRIVASTNFKNCHLTISFGLDTRTNEILSQNKKIKEKIGSTIDFDKIQLRIIEDLMKDMLVKADKVSSLILNSDIDITASEEKEGSPFDIYKLKYASDLIIENWENSCDAIYNFTATEPLTNIERQEYIYLASRCMSKDIMEKLIYPTDKNNFGNYLRTANYLKSNNIELCSHDYNNNEGSFKSKKIIQESAKESDLSLNESEIVFATNISSKSLENCLIEQCSSLSNTKNSNIYMCSNLIYLFDQIENNKKMEKTGFLTLGAYMYSMFSGTKVNESTKNLINSFVVKYKTAVGKDSPKLENNLLNLTYKFSSVSQSSDTKLEMIAPSFKYSVIPDFKEDFERRKTQETGIEAMFNTGEGAHYELLGAKRLSTCIKNPQRIIDGYSCNSVPEEFNGFGRTLSEFLIETKIMLHTFSMVANGIKNLNNKKLKSNAGTKENSAFKTQTIKNGATTTMVLAAFSATINAFSEIAPDFTYVLSKFSDSFFDIDNVETNSFGNLTNEKIEDQIKDLSMGYSTGIAIVGALASNSAFGDLINTIINFLLIIALSIAYIVPLFPLYLWFVIVVGWLLLLFETMAILPVWIPSIATPTQNETSDLEKRGLSIVLKLFLKAPLICVGLLISWILTNSIVSNIAEFLTFDKIFSVDYGYSPLGLIDALVIIIVYVIFFIYILNMLVTIIEGFYEFGTSWLDAKGKSNAFGKTDLGSSIAGNQYGKQAVDMLNPLKRKADMGKRR